MYDGQTAVVSTQHGKEKLIQKPFKEGLGIDIVLPDNIDTDTLGTFTGEVERPGTMEEVIIAKAKMGLKQTKLFLAVASEGSFGPHPSIPFIGSDYEMLAFVDENLQIAVIEKTLSAKTNFSHRVVTPDDDIDEYLSKVGFPTHGMICKPNTYDKKDCIYKGIQDAEKLRQYIKICADISQDKKAHIETDMRAHMNPTRCLVIEELTHRLVKRINALCPACQTPGFGMVATERGLSCESCGGETQMVKHEIWGCVKCEFKNKQPRADGRIYAQTQYCGYCNP